MRLTYGFRGLVLYPHGRMYDNSQADMMLENELEFYMCIIYRQGERERSWNWLQTFIQFISVSFSFSEMAFRTQILHSYLFSFTFLLPFLKVDLLSVCLLIIEHYKLSYNASNIAKFRKLKTEA